MSKISYLIRSILKQPFRENFCCPNCNGVDAIITDRKYWVTQLRRCSTCDLLFRTPTDTEEYSHTFYNEKYVQGSAMICPTPTDLAELVAKNFAGTDRSYATYISFLRGFNLKPNSRLLDFGCSWGFGSYQFAKADFDTHSFEIAVDRRNYGIANLGVRHLDDIYSISPGHPLFQSFDCFFSAHVLEHVPSPSRVIDLAWNCLKPGGLFVAFTPNGCDKYRAFDERAWRNMWGEVHPNYLDDKFYARQFPRSKSEILASDGGDVMKQYELGLIAWKPKNKHGF